MRDVVIAACGVTIVALLFVIAYQNHQRFHKPLLTTTYQAVTLLNGETFYGRIDHLGTDHPVLREAFTLHFETDPQGRSPKRALVRRKDTLTGADHVVFPATAIAFVEPVTADSAVGRLIQEAGPAR